MPDPRWETLAEILIHHSTRLSRGETLLIECFDLEDDTLPRLLVQKAARKGRTSARRDQGHAHRPRAGQERLRGADEGDRASTSCTGWSGCRPTSRCGAPGTSTRWPTSPPRRWTCTTRTSSSPVHFERRIKHTRWCVLRLPDAEHGAAGGDEHRGVRGLLLRRLQPRLRRGSPGRSSRWSSGWTAAREVHITGPETDLRFSIEGIPVVPCAGEMNIPDGEVFTAPGARLGRGARPVQHADDLPGILVRRRPARVPRRAGSSRPTAPAGDVKKLRRIFDADEGAAYIGEWSIGCNPRILQPMRDILFDEKIAGSFHLTPGQRLRRGRQRQPVEDPLGPRPDPAPRVRRRHASPSTASRSASTAGSSPRSCRRSTRSDGWRVERGGWSVEGSEAVFECLIYPLLLTSSPYTTTLHPPPSTLQVWRVQRRFSSALSAPLDLLTLHPPPSTHHPPRVAR